VKDRKRHKRLAHKKSDTPHAKAFAQVSSYSEGFDQGFLISWRRAGARQVDQKDVVGQLSSHLKISALLEPSSESECWQLYTPNGPQEVSVRYLSDGIEVKPKK
jgi:hypothetical protein